MNTLRASFLSGASSNRTPLLTSVPSKSINIHKDKIPAKVLSTVADNSFLHQKKKNIVDYFVTWSQSLRKESVQPENGYLLLWHAVIMFIILYYLFQIGLLWGYGIQVWIDQINYLYFVNIIFIILLLVDCGITGFKSFYQHGLLITNRRLIIKRYLVPWFWLDLLAIISISIPVISDVYQLNWIKVLFLVKIRTASHIDQQFSRVTQLRINLHTLYLLSRLMLFLVLWSHYLGIWFYMIDYWVYQNNYYGPNTPNICWLYNAQAYSQMVLLLPWYGQYQYTMYFSIGTMTTIAYGDITPLNPLQTIYICIVLLLYTIAFGYILSEVLRILMEAQAAKFQHSNNLLVVSNMMKNHHIKKSTQQKVKSYFEKVWKEQIYRNRVIQKQLIDSLPYKIKNQLLFKLYEDFFKTVGFIYAPSNTFHSEFMIGLADSTKQERLIEGHYLYKQAQEYQPLINNSHSIYFIKKVLKGRPKPSVELGVSGIVLKSLSTGEFGQEAFLTGQAQNHWAKAISSVLVFYIPRTAFLQKLSFATEREKQNIFHLTQKIGIKKCLVCEEERQNELHSFLSCPFVTYRPHVLSILKKKSKNLNQRVKNNIYQRQQKIEKGKFNALIQYKNLKNTKYQVKDIFRLLLSNQYYGSLFKKQKDQKPKQQIKKEDLNIRMVESEEESEDESSIGVSSESSQDLQHYMKQTQIFIQYLQENQVQKNPLDRRVIHNLTSDVAKQFTLYKPHDNPGEVLKRYRVHLNQGLKRRKIQILHFN